MPDAFHCVCRNCRAVLVAVGPQLDDAALAMLARHVRRVQPDVALSADASASVVLAHITVERSV